MNKELTFSFYVNHFFFFSVTKRLDLKQIALSEVELHYSKAYSPPRASSDIYGCVLAGEFGGGILH